MSLTRRLSHRKSTTTKSCIINDGFDDLNLHEPAWNGDISLMKTLLKNPDHKIHINDPDMEWEQRTPLHIAADRGRS